MLNKMYIMPEGVTGEDKLSSYSFLTKKMLNATPQWGYVCPLFGEALEVVSAGHRGEYGKEDAYWSTWD